MPPTPADGQLSDSRLDHPRYPHAVYACYKGDKIESFWHKDSWKQCKADGTHPGDPFMGAGGGRRRRIRAGRQGTTRVRVRTRIV